MILNRARTHWHNWFAWRPIKIDNMYVWFQSVMRRYNAEYNYWQYEHIEK